MKYQIHADYQSRHEDIVYKPIATNFSYQPDVYALAQFIAQRSELRSIIDIGTKHGGNLDTFTDDVSILVIGAMNDAINPTSDNPKIRPVPYNLEQGLPEIPDEIVEKSIIICADIIEHLKDPEPLLRQLAEMSQVAPYILISTPDRDRVRGWLDNGPPANPAHVREWNGGELVRFLTDCGFGDIPFYGHTISTDFHKVKSTLLTLTGTHAKLPRKAPDHFTVAAIISGLNEADILEEVVIHLNQQGIQVHYFDNWSTDGSWEIMCNLRDQGAVMHCGRFPDKPSDQHELYLDLQNKVSYGEQLRADWIIHHDADEIRICPWLACTLKDAIAHVDALGFNAIDFTVIDFRYTRYNEEIFKNYENGLTHFEFGRRPGHFSQLKCWKNQKNVILTESGGHEARFPGRRIFPLKFLLKHYPLRNRSQAKTKIFRDRLPRFKKGKELYGWHTHYDVYMESGVIPEWESYNLIPWHPILFNTEYLVERLSGIGLSGK